MENIFFVIFGLLLGGCFYMMFVVPNLKSRKRKAIEVACVRYLAEAVNFENEEKEEKIAIAKNFIEKTYLDSSKSKLEDFERFLANPLSDKEPLFSQLRQLSSIELSFLVETVIEMAYSSGWYEESYNKYHYGYFVRRGVCRRYMFDIRTQFSEKSSQPFEYRY
ncbi:MAG: hypothetical protein MJZ00_03505 [Paludibacteraceae bacterium]|nr:hypothetical protein [Paludibacteraceae bacterium]